jgi:hypothetical protein
MDVFREYKPIRNKIALLSVEDALAVIWAYCQHLQVDNFRFPKEVEVADSYLKADFPQKWISEWELELLAKEVIINASAVASKSRTLRTWKTLSELINSLKGLENRIYGAVGSPQDVLVELIRIAHRQFIWQGNSPNSASIIRYFKIFNRPGIDAICEQKIGLNIWQIYMCGVASMGFFLDRPAIVIPFRSEIKALPVEFFDKFFAFTSKPLAQLKAQLKSEQRYDADFAYAYNSLRTCPLVRMSYQGADSYVCPLMTLLYWKFTGGLYYEFIGVQEFGNEFGDGFQNYVGEVVERACSHPMKLATAGLAPDMVERMPYSVWAIEELEVGLQIMKANGIADVIEGKWNSLEMRQWDWHAYLTRSYPDVYPAKQLFAKEYDEIFSPLYAAQHAGN